MLTLNRPDKRNAMCDQLLRDNDAFFSARPEGVRVVPRCRVAAFWALTG
ncbi:MAG: enoyl-CoA hydratase/carnithine racemase [Paracoccaceae bacterium]